MGNELQLLVESIPTHVVVTTPSGDVETVNRPTLEYFGKTLEELKGWKTSDIVHPDDLQHTIAAQQKGLETGRAYNVESRHRRADGVYRWFNVLGLPLIDADGRVLRWFHLISDIDDRKRAEEALRASEINLRQIIDTIPGLVFTLSPAGVVQTVNQQLLEYFGKTLEELNNWRLNDAVHPDDLPRVISAFTNSMTTGTPIDFELRYRRADGVYRWFQARALPVRDTDGRIIVWYALVTDMEDRKQAEEERERLRQVQADLAHLSRVTTMGELTASLAHEIKQPIAAAATDAKTCLRWLRRDKPDVAEACEAASRLVKDVTRASDIISSVSSLFKKGALQRELVDVNELIREMITLLRSEANRYSISLRIELAEDLPKVMADRVQLQQVFMNLMLNGIDAMKGTTDGGELTIKLETSDRQLLISVSDTGVGLPPKQAEEIFKAFFTTKDKGTGMGLPISRSIIESHGGRLWASGTSGKGATFQFTLPTTLVAHA